MMDLDEAIQHCKEQVQEQAKRGCYSCAEEHQQLAEWLKELKEYREFKGGQRMTIGEEVLIHGYIDEIRKDIVIIRNEGGYFGTVPEEIRSSSEIPNTCGDAISRQAVDDAIYDYSRSCDANYQQIMEFIEKIPSVSPQQRTGRWEYVRYEGFCGNWHCSECRTIIPHMPEEKDNTPIYKWCPMCGAKMEVEE